MFQLENWFVVELMAVKTINGITIHDMKLTYLTSSLDKEICLIGTCAVFDNIHCIYFLFIYLFALYLTWTTVLSET